MPQPRRWAALSDIHGQAGLFLNLLKAQRVLDAKGHWQFGDGVMVINGDVFDCGLQQTKALWALYRFQQEASTQGGSVPLVLGRHETMVLRGDFRYLHPRYLDLAELLKCELPEFDDKDADPVHGCARVPPC